MSSGIQNTMVTIRKSLEVVEKQFKEISINDLLSLNGEQQTFLLETASLLEDLVNRFPLVDYSKVEVENGKIRKMKITVNNGNILDTTIVVPQLTSEMFDLVHSGYNVSAARLYRDTFEVSAQIAWAACEQYYEAKRSTIPNPWPYDGSYYVAKLLD